MKSQVPFAIGDLQGCCGPLEQLLAHPALTGAPLRFVGDLVNRGPCSAQTLRQIIALGPRARAVLGNHDIHLLAVAAGVRKAGKSDTLNDVLAAPDAEDLLTWLRHQPLAVLEHGFLLVHAGVLPQWTATQVLELASEVEAQLRGPHWREFLAEVFGNTPARWDDKLRGLERLRVVVNALTRLRFCAPDGEIEFATKEGAGAAPAGFMPWFEVPQRQTADCTVVFGHWSTLGLLLRDNVIGLDTGCVWGGKLTAVSLEAAPQARGIVQIQCEQAQAPQGNQTI